MTKIARIENGRFIRLAPRLRGRKISTPRVIVDSQDAVKSMADGKTYDSKSALRRTYKNGPTKYEETGNEPLINKPPEVNEREIEKLAAEAYRDLTK